jgi:pilus assembly protein Flp/PilA
MRRFQKRVATLVWSEDGPTAVEYAVMMALVIIVCLASIKSVGTKASSTFSNAATSMGS